MHLVKFSIFFYVAELTHELIKINELTLHLLSTV